MQATYFYLVLMLSFSLNSCKEHHQTINPIESALSSDLPNIKNIMDRLEKHEIQIRYTQIDRKNDSVILTDFDYQVNPNNYFYPSGTVQFPLAVLALEKLNTIKEFDMHTNFFVEGDSLETTIAKEIFKVFSVNDDEAYNRLFEFLGQDEINQKLNDKGIKYVRISERATTPNAADITTKSLVVSINDSTTQIIEKSINSPVV